MDLYEFYLHDVAGREIGIMDLQGDLTNEHRCTWSWFLFGNQRHLRIEPLSAQQPYLFDADWSQREMADQTNSEYSHVRQLLLAAYSPLHGVSYPVSFVHMDTTGVDLWLTALQYDSLLLAEPELQAAAEWYTFTSPKDQVSLRRSNAERDEVLISAGELLNEGLQRGAGGQASAQPFTYTEFSDTHLNKVYFYAYDHLGNTRVTYSQDCKNWNNVEPSDEDDVNIEYAADYYPYGKVLREFVNERAEKYLTTGNERDQETGLDYREARYYDSDVARFLSLDPLGGHEAQIDKSSYMYVWGNPVSNTDPDGKCPTCPGGVLFNLDMIIKAAKKPNSAAAYYVGFGVGAGNHIVGVANALRHPIDAVRTGMAAQQVGTPENVQATVGLAGAAIDLVHGNGIQRGKVLGGATMMALEGVALSKGVGALMGGGGEALSATEAITPRFIVSEGSTVVHASQTEMIQSLENAGYVSTPTESAGVQFKLPNGVQARAMQPAGPNGFRTAFQNSSGTYVTPEGKVPQPPKGLSTAERKTWLGQRTHINQRR